jgi:hypothetical protein
MPPLGGDWVVPPKRRLGLPLYRGLKVSAIATEEAMSTQDKEQTRAAWDKIAAGYESSSPPRTSAWERGSHGRNPNIDWADRGRASQRRQKHRQLMRVIPICLRR